MAWDQCFGNWDIHDTVCAGCSVVAMCERRTKSRRLGGMQFEEENEAPVSPVDYLLISLSGKYDKREEKNETAVMHLFEKNGNPVIAVLVSNQGKVRLKSNKGTLDFDVLTIEKIEEAIRQLT